MKLKSIKNVAAETKFVITVQTNGKYKTYYIDYCSKKHGITTNCDTHMDCDSWAWLPEEILNREVTFISVNRAVQALAIDCLEKENRI